jgi:glycerate 2-kinase
MMRVIIAPDKYKGCLTAAAVAGHLAEGLRKAVPGVDLSAMPVADGGDGFLAAASAAGFRSHPVRASGPTGDPVETSYASLNDVAVIELASICGLSLLPGGRRRPLDASSYGVGEVLSVVLEQHIRMVVLGIGGSASTDGGSGMLQALGAELYDASGLPLPKGGAALADVAGIGLQNMHSRLKSVELVVACDVNNPLTGPTGAAAVFAPQKGASPAEVELLDRSLRQWAAVVAAATGADRASEPGAGAAGGVGFAAIAVLGATLRPGIDLMLELVNFKDLLIGASLVITGEGSLDAQTMSGKAPSGVARVAAAMGITTIAVAGQCTLGPDELDSIGIRQAYALSDLEPDPQRSMANAGQLLERVAAQIASDWLSPE